MEDQQHGIDTTMTRGTANFTSEASPATMDTAVLIAKYNSITFSKKHASVKAMHNEWYGLGEFKSDQLPEGGMMTIEQMYGPKWRTGWNSGGKNKHYTRVVAIVKALDKKKSSTKKTIEETIDGYEEFFKSKNKGIRPLYLKLREEKWIPNRQDKSGKPAAAAAGDDSATTAVATDNTGFAAVSAATNQNSINI